MPPKVKPPLTFSWAVESNGRSSLSSDQPPQLSIDIAWQLPAWLFFTTAWCVFGVKLRKAEGDKWLLSHCHNVVMLSIDMLLKISIIAASPKAFIAKHNFFLLKYKLVCFAQSTDDYIL